MTVKLGFKWTHLIMSAVLIIATGFIFFGELIPRRQTAFKSLKNCLPHSQELNDWSVNYVPLADSPEALHALKNILRYDDAVSVIYLSGSTRISVYAAYWRPDRMPYRVVASHTPDACWVVSGWNCLYKRELTTLVGKCGSVLPKAQLRTFVKAGYSEYVVFWHIVGRNALSYGGLKGEPPWYAVLTDIFNIGFRQRDEQFILRISSNQPFDVFYSTTVVKKIIQSFPIFEMPSN